MDVMETAPKRVLVRLSWRISIVVALATFACTAAEEMRIPPAPKTGEHWQPGVHYSVLLGPIGTEVGPRKIEVRELFMYTSPKSHDIQLYLKEWLRHKPDYVEYIRSPAIVFPHARLQARMFFTLQELGREDLHDALFAWVYDAKHYEIYHTIEHPDEPGYLRLNLQFAEAHKLSTDRFAELYGSHAMDDKVIKAEIATHAYLVAGTSTFVINGRYSTSSQRVSYAKRLSEAEEYARLFSLIDYLVAAEASMEGLR